MKPEKNKIFRTITLYLSLAFFMLFLLGPFLWSVKSSFQTNRELIRAIPTLIPHEAWWINYQELFTGGVIRSPESVSAYGIVPLFVRWLPIAMVNTFVVAGVVTALALVLGSLAGYSISRMGFRGGNQLLTFYLATRSIPSIAIIVPIFLLMKSFRLLDTLQGLIIVDTVIVLPFAVWILAEYFRTIPMDLDEAAKLDGCSRLGILFRIIYPASMPGLVATGIFSVMMVWNMFLAALILASSTDSIQVTNIAAMFVNEIHVEYGLLNTAAVIIAIPPIILALIFQRYIMKGLVAGSVKR